MTAPLEAGTFLIASLSLEDLGEPNFGRAVVLILQYSKEEGTLGVVINRPLGDKIKLYTGEALQDLTDGLETLEGAPVEPSSMFFQGGPMERTSLIFLHQLDDLIEGGTEVCRDLYVGGELNTIRTHTAVMDAESPVLRFYLGYAGWSPGQLENEIEQGAWLLSPGHADLVFSTEPDLVWQKATHDMGGRYRPLSYVPEDLRVN